MNTQTLLFSLIPGTKSNAGCRTQRVRHTVPNVNDWTNLHGFCAGLKHPPLPWGITRVLRTPLCPLGLPIMTHVPTLHEVSSELLICWRALSGFSGGQTWIVGDGAGKWGIESAGGAGVDPYHRYRGPALNPARTQLACLLLSSFDSVPHN